MLLTKAKIALGLLLLLGVAGGGVSLGRQNRGTAPAAENLLEIVLGRSEILKLEQLPRRIQIGDESVASYALTSPTELTLQGLEFATTWLNVWYPDPANPNQSKLRSFVVRVLSEDARCHLASPCKNLEKQINCILTDSKISLVLVGDKLTVSGHVKDRVEARRILNLVRANALPENDDSTDLSKPASADAPPAPVRWRPIPQIVNRIQVPGEQPKQPVETARSYPPQSPTARQLIAYLNELCGRQPILQCEMDLTVRQDIQSIGMEGNLVIQQPHDVRMQTRALGKPQLDLGSNAQGWWYWCFQDRPPALLQAKRADILRGTAAWPRPFGPETLVWIMGMKKYDPAAPVEVILQEKTIELVEKAQSPQGKPLRLVTIFNRWEVSPPKPQILGYRVEDARKREVFHVEVREVKLDRASGAVVPTKLHLTWPAEKLEATMRLSKTEVCASLQPGRAKRYFTPPAVGKEPGRIDQEPAEPAKIKGTLPASWEKLGLTDDQVQQVYRLQARYRDQIAELKKTEQAELEKVLTATQKARLKKIVDSKLGEAAPKKP